MNTNANGGNARRRTFNERVIFLLVFLIISLFLGGLMIAYSDGVNKVYTFTWGLALVATGGFFGFLFGLPSKPLESNTGLIENTNIYEISNWLTKIIIGAGLVQLKEISSFAYRFSTKVASGITETDNIEKTSVFTIGLLTYSFLLGVVGGYILTQFFLVAELNAHKNNAGNPTITDLTKDTNKPAPAPAIFSRQDMALATLFLLVSVRRFISRYL